MRRLGVIVSLLAPSAARAQLPPVGVPAGVVRLEVDGAFETWDSRWVDGTEQPLGGVPSALGSNLVPSLTAAEARIRQITGLVDYSYDLGALSADVLADRGIALFGLSLGVTRSLTLFGRMPLVRSRVQPTLRLDPAASNAGASPGAVVQADFFSQFDNAITTLSARIAAGDYDGNPSQRDLAEATLASAGGLRDQLFLLLADPDEAAPFLPVAGSEAGVAITGQVTSLQVTLANDLGVTGFAAVPALPGDPATDGEVVGALADPDGQGIVVGETLVSFRGDAEAGASLTLADRWDRGASRGGFRAAVEGLVRFPTGRIGRTDRVLALGTGDGQTDIEVRGTVDVGSGAFGARLEGNYNRQLAADYVQRVAAPSELFPGRDRLANVRRDPGDVVTLAVRPFVRIARTLALIGGLELQSRGRDEVSYLSESDAIPGVDADVLAEGTDARATVVAIGVTYANPGRLRPGGRGLPVDAAWTYERVLDASRGIVPDIHRVRARLRVYVGVF